jgi:uncharacterized protein (DUF2267 family)
MGGSAFSPTLYTPRMPPDVYAHVLSEVHRKLRTLYEHVETPVEAPGKVDYGDLDVLVYSPLLSRNLMVSPTAATEGAEIALLLGAETWKRARGGEEMHLALPWPKEFASPSGGTLPAEAPMQTAQQSSEISVPNIALTQLSLSSTSTTPQTAYIQVDLHICPNLKTYSLERLRCAYGDFWSIVGSVIRAYGLSFRPTGLYIRIPEVEKVNRKLALVLFTSSPDGILGFLFKDAKGWGDRDRFASLEEMCDFIRQNCRFYRPPREQEKPEDGGDDNDDEKQIGARVDLEKAWKKKDRDRVMKRSGFRYWVEEYIPKHSAADRERGFRGEYADLDREEVAEMVKKVYGGMAEEYEQKQKLGLRQINLKQLWTDVRVAVTSPPAVESELDKNKGKEKDTITTEQIDTSTIHPQFNPTFVLRTLRRRLSLEASDKPDDQLDEMQLAYREGNFEDVKEWAVGNWRDVAEKKWEDNRVNSAAHLREKMERENERYDRQTRMENAMVFKAVLAAGNAGRERDGNECG